MGGRLLKKLTGASAGSAAAADGENEDAGEGTSKAVATATSKKRKVPATAQGDASPVKGEISTTASGYLTYLKRALHSIAIPAKNQVVSGYIGFIFNGSCASVIVVVVMPLEDWLRCTFPGDEEG